VSLKIAIGTVLNEHQCTNSIDKDVCVDDNDGFVVVKFGVSDAKTVSSCDFPTKRKKTTMQFFCNFFIQATKLNITGRVADELQTAVNDMSADKIVIDVDGRPTFLLFPINKKTN
jgi:hypothetical protein